MKQIYDCGHMQCFGVSV